MANRSAADFGRLAEAAAALALARLAAAIAPFSWIARAASWRGQNQSELTDGDAAADLVVLAVERASRRLPWRCVCLHIGLAAQWMLRRRGIRSQLHYGIRPDEERLSAHVWVGLGNRILIGEVEAPRHARVASFPADAS